ncbi:MAG TPA: hypothetical protein VKE51_22450 [Vicinamibacterales bacterium]|nr:hypothetical protein [Vicinamibacterales bacterium]
MSGYFDALMRASGMAIGGPAPTAMLRQSDAFEAVADTGASGMETTVDVPAMPPASRRPAEPVLAAAKPFVVNDPIVHRANAIATRDDARVAPAPREAAVESPVHRTARLDAPSTQDLGARLVRAAVRWIAADTSSVGQGSANEPAPAPRDEARYALPPQKHDGDRIPPRIVTLAERAADTAESAPAAPVRTPVEVARAVEPRQVHAAPLADDETVEISIGAIHVRVDAPTAQTVARPAATSPVNTQRAGAVPPRSALSRRALRRV